MHGTDDKPIPHNGDPICVIPPMQQGFVEPARDRDIWNRVFVVDAVSTGPILANFTMWSSLNCIARTIKLPVLHFAKPVVIV